MASPIRGIFVPHVTPVDNAGRLNESELRRYLEWLIAQGVHGLYPNGSTGEFTRFTADQRRQIVRIACETAAGRVPVLAGAAEANVIETLRACEAYASYGARAVAIVSPFYYKLSPPAVYSYFHEIALNSPIDVTLYNIPMFATPLDVPTIRRLSQLERIVGIKDSSGDVAFMLRLMSAVRAERPEFVFLSGWEPTLMPLLVMGIDGGTHATGGVAPELTRRVYELTKSGDLDAARPLHFHLIGLFDALLAAGDFPAGFRAGVELRGFSVGHSPQPACIAPQAARKIIAKELTSVLEALKAQ
jgi:4-hydroxy-tetrahydrodipicolinate synthase